MASFVRAVGVLGTVLLSCAILAPAEAQSGGASNSEVADTASATSAVDTEIAQELRRLNEQVSELVQVLRASRSDDGVSIKLRQLTLLDGAIASLQEEIRQLHVERRNLAEETVQTNAELEKAVRTQGSDSLAALMVENFGPMVERLRGDLEMLEKRRMLVEQRIVEVRSTLDSRRSLQSRVEADLVESMPDR